MGCGDGDVLSGVILIGRSQKHDGGMGNGYVSAGGPFFSSFSFFILDIYW